MVRMRLADLTYEVLQKIVAIYDEVVGGHGSRYMHPSDVDYVIDHVQRAQPVEWRFGSRLSQHSKLWIQASYMTGQPLIHFRFDLNWPYKQKMTKEAEALEPKFEQAVDEFLKEKKLAV